VRKRINDALKSSFAALASRIADLTLPELKFIALSSAPDIFSRLICSGVSCESRVSAAGASMAHCSCVCENATGAAAMTSIIAMAIVALSFIILSSVFKPAKTAAARPPFKSPNQRSSNVLIADSTIIGSELLKNEPADDHQHERCGRQRSHSEKKSHAGSSCGGSVSW
jgi:hypothetical protein